MTDTPHQSTRTREADCPRCHEVCGWCSDYRWYHGRMTLGGEGRCTIKAMHPDPVCAVCGGTRRVMMTTTIRCEAIPHA